MANLYDFESGKQESRKDLSLIDRWILERLDGVIRTCRSAYENFEFHKVYHTLNQFCAVDLSSLYVDITKDRMYCDPPDSPRRRATQSAMREIFDALCRLLAPVLVFTGEEAWRHSALAKIGDAGQPVSPTPATTSVHVQEFPQPQNRGHEASDQVEELLRLRAVIGQAIEQARQEKLIGNTLEARVVLNSNSDVTTKISREELEEFFILSDLTIQQAKEPSAIGNENAVSEVCALLASSPNGRREQSASGFVRSLRERGERAIVVMSSEAEVSVKLRSILPRDSAIALRSARNDESST